MSLKYRKQTRTLAHKVLGDYYKNMLLAFKDSQKNLYLLYSDAKSNGNLGLKDPVLYWAASKILTDRKFLELAINTDKKLFKITDEGINAYRSSILLVENRKDRLESIELHTKWIIPIGSFIISVIAFILSIYKK